MNFLFVHQNFPGQYRHLAPALIKAGHTCVAIAGPSATGIAGIKLLRCKYQGTSQPIDVHPWAQDLHIKCLRAEAVAAIAIELRNDGFQPDLIIGHPGWGELLVIKDIFASVPVLHQLEFIYQLSGADFNFDSSLNSAANPESDWQIAAKLRLRRAPQLLALHDLNHAIAPTHWQASTAPSIFADRISVIHEGINTEQIHPNPLAEVRLAKAKLSFRPGDELISFVARNLEPYRGFHVFMRTLPLLQQLRPNCHVIIVGGDSVSYGSAPKNGGTWREALLAELSSELDLSRIHFVGRIPHNVLHKVFQVCACHVYLTYPFVLSWSMLEAMSCGALVVASATPPVQEVIINGKNGLLVDFFDSQALANQIAAVLTEPTAYKHLAQAAREHVQATYDLNNICLPKQLQLVHQLTTKVAS